MSIRENILNASSQVSRQGSSLVLPARLPFVDPESLHSLFSLSLHQQHIHLTNQISPIASAPENLIKNTDLIHTINGKLTSRRNMLKSLGIASERLYQDYKSHESSFGKRLMLKTGGESGSRSKKMQESKRKWEHVS